MKKLINEVLKPNVNHIINIFMIVLGSIGLIKNLYHSLYFPLETIISFILVVLIGIGIYLYFIKYEKMPRKYFVYSLIALIILMVLVFYNEFNYFINAFYDVIKHDYFLKFEDLLPLDLLSRGVFYQIVMLFLGLIIVYLIVSLICMPRFSLLKILVMIMIFMFPMFIKHNLSVLESHCFIIFICYEFFSTIILKYQTPQYPLKIIILSFLCITSIITSIYLEDKPFFQQNSTSILSQLIDWSISGKKNPLNFAIQTGMSSDIDGTLPTGDIQLNRNIALTVQADTPFSSYLRGYSLADYHDNEWHGVNENYIDSRSLTMYSDFLAINYLPLFESVKIIPEGHYDFQFTPYYLINNYNRRPLLYDSYIESTEDPLNVMYQYDIKPDSTTLIVSEQFDYDYGDYVYRNYMNVPEELDDLLVDLLSSNDMLSLRFNVDLAIEKVRKLLDDETTYELNAGSLPGDKDFVEYFLFENRRGSCTHYATAGALLLRKIGIPTRFVKGYIMKASDFHDGEAKIPQYRSHAWIEVYRDYQGWVPYEMTPTGNLEEISDIIDDRVVQSQQTSNQENTSTNRQEQNTNNTTTRVANNQETTQVYEYIEIITYMISAFIIIVSYRYITKHWLIIKTRHMTNKQKIIIYYNVIWKLSLHHVEDGDLKNLAYRAKYSSHEITDEQWHQFYQLYLQWIDQYYESLKWYQKFIFKFIQGYK